MIATNDSDEVNRMNKLVDTKIQELAAYLRMYSTMANISDRSRMRCSLFSLVLSGALGLWEPMQAPEPEKTT